MLKRRVERFLKTCRVAPGASLLIGFSGGPDSTCLVHIMHELSLDYRYALACAYLDHGLRPAAERREEGEQVTAVCRRLGLPLYQRRLAEGELKERARATGKSLEETARRARIAFFQELRHAHGCERLLLAHTLDDQLETILMRLGQGSGPGGLRGMRSRRGWILRPFLTSDRNTVGEWLRRKDVSFIIDSTNEQEDFLRNRVRHALLPVIKNIFPGAGRSLAALSEKMAYADEYLKKKARSVIRWEKTDNGLKTDADVFFKRPVVLRMYALYHAVGRMSRGQAVSLPFRFLRPLLKAREGRDYASRVLLSGRGMRARLKGSTLFLERDIVEEGKKGYVINVVAGKPFTLFDRQYVADYQKAEKGGKSGNVRLWRVSKPAFPIILRSRKPGDRIDLGFGRKKLKKLFNEWQVEEEKRDKIPILVDANGVTAVWGSIFGYPDIMRFGAAINEDFIQFVELTVSSRNP